MTINSDFEYLLNVAIKQYDYTDIVLTNKHKEIIFSMNYELLDMVPLTATRDFVDQASQEEQNWSQILRNAFIDDNLRVLSIPVYAYEQSYEVIETLNIVLNQEAMNKIVQSGIDKIGVTKGRLLYCSRRKFADRY